MKIEIVIDWSHLWIDSEWLAIHIGRFPKPGIPFSMGIDVMIGRFDPSKLTAEPALAPTPARSRKKSQPVARKSASAPAAGGREQRGETATENGGRSGEADARTKGKPRQAHRTTQTQQDRHDPGSAPAAGGADEDDIVF